MPEAPRPRHPGNAPGDFYTEAESCMHCDAPRSSAPDLIDYDESNEDEPCRFFRQPETPDEVERAVEACQVSCIGAVRYGGKNRRILARFRALRSGDSCDFADGRADG